MRGGASANPDGRGPGKDVGLARDGDPERGGHAGHPRVHVSALIAYPGLMGPGFNRSLWKGTITWQLDGYSDRGDPLIDCTYKGSGTYPTRAEIHLGQGEGGPTRLAVGIYASHFPQDGPMTGTLVRSCVYGPNGGTFKGRDVWYSGYMPVITSLGLSLPRGTRSFNRVVQTEVTWLDRQIIRKFPVRIAFKDISKSK